MVGEEEVTDINEYNDLPASKGELVPLKPKRIFEWRPHRFSVKAARRDLMAVRAAHGADSAIGHRCSNLVELLQMPELPKRLIEKQMNDLARLRAGLQ